MKRIELKQSDLPGKIHDSKLRDEILSATGLDESEVSIVRVHDGADAGLYIDIRKEIDVPDLTSVVQSHAPDKTIEEEIADGNISDFDSKILQSPSFQALLSRVEALEKK